jgi:NAD(P)-dependent dehydrogenase (short-subunit alcohol dehydrogenase family)
MKKYYQNKVAVVTGVASGIGLALSELILSSGAKIVEVIDIPRSRGRAQPGVLTIRAEIRRK